ncbi:hypothetical protein DICPUDRAFT_99017 [Dictyostelium purpureum]|uniref:Transmembrane protein n=1 Tax=Dictyostelium purpureum TaxID=5786 RepID=F0ZVK4_DICPU|nr:uncharacterized protein DICPUDRAFT_99017 [Dictyostelium purpureum]EGC32026.1 hypothetical protein DICPUDRAFT_99017 [Dictyostelium purpureum]|eukprot:XP_003291444.1 hypothetical protein DICPUDRAFT_99017 [Dictyostelium purpureum]
MGASDNQYTPVQTQEPQPQPQQPYNPNVYVYPQQQQQNYSQYPGNQQPSINVEPVLVIDTSLTDSNLNCCEHCQLKECARVQQYSICSPFLYQIVFLFFSPYPYFYLFVAPIIGLIAAYTKKRWVVIIHFITTFLYYSLTLTMLILSITSLATQSTIFYILFSILLFIIFAISLKSYARYIKTLGLLNIHTECTCSLSGISVSSPEQSSSQPIDQQTVVIPQPTIIAQPTFQPQVVYDNNQNSYYLIPIQNSNQN